MNKIFKTFKIMLPILIIASVLTAVTFFASIFNSSNDSLESGLAAFFSVYFGIFPLFLLIPAVFALFIIEICVCVKKNKRGSLIAAIVFLFILAPALLVYLWLAMAMNGKIAAILVSVVTILVYFTTLVLAFKVVRNLDKLAIEQNKDNQQSMV